MFYQILNSMERMKISIKARIAFHQVYGWFAVMEEKKMQTIPDRFIVIMDSSGLPTWIHESDLYTYVFYSTLDVSNSGDLLVLLRELEINTNRFMITPIIQNFKTVYCNE